MTKKVATTTKDAPTKVKIHHRKQDSSSGQKANNGRSDSTVKHQRETKGTTGTGPQVKK